MVLSPSDKLNAQPSATLTPSSRVMFSSRFTPLPQPNTSSVSLVSSTAQGRPIPLSDASAADRTAALRELSRTQPIARRPYDQVSGPPPSNTSTTTGTYSQPVLVRTYSGPISSSARARSVTRGDDVSSGRNRLNAPLSSSGGPRRPRRSVLAISTVRPPVEKKPSSRGDMKLPPVEAFTFKSILSEIEQDISVDLDHIADICARLRYSLSNQYEIHVAPHGSGNNLLQTDPAYPASMSTVPLRRDHGGPTLQAMSIDNASTSQEGRITIRRGSAAYGTLEIIMNSSRSSEEDRGKRKSAADTAAQVRRRTQRSNQDGSGGSKALNIEARANSEHHDKQTRRPSGTRPSLAAAILGHSHHRSDSQPSRSHLASSTILVGYPAVPETSHNHLASSATSKGPSCGHGTPRSTAEEQTLVSVSSPVAAAAIAIPEESNDLLGPLSRFRFSIPWKGISVEDIHPATPIVGKTESYAEGALRQLLRISTQSGCRGVKFTDGASGGTG